MKIGHTPRTSARERDFLIDMGGPTMEARQIIDIGFYSHESKTWIGLEHEKLD